MALLTVRHPMDVAALLRLCDRLTEALLYGGALFGPWAFGTTESWSIQVMNLVGSGLGLLLALKWGLRRMRRCPAPPPAGAVSPPETPGPPPGGPVYLPRLLSASLALLTVILLGYCLTSAVNAFATYHHAPPRFEYHRHLAWLPHSGDRSSTWAAFWQYLGLALLFWATRDWLLDKDRHEQRRADPDSRPTGWGQPRHNHGWHPSARRLRRLLIVLCLNGSLLAVESIAQWAEGSGKLLFLVRPRINQTAPGQFGPYAYRSNAAQYFNLLWPVCAGVAWMEARAARQARRAGMRNRRRTHVWLAIGTILMAACPVISTSRGGALVALGTMPLVLGVLIAASRGASWRLRLGLFLFFVVTVQLALFLGWDRLRPRLEAALNGDGLRGRAQTYAVAAGMARDFPMFGTGPGTFAVLYQFYRQPADYPAAEVHNDWLETRITFGWIGLVLLLLALLVVLSHWFLGEGIPIPWVLVAMIWLALGGCLAHARFDFPLQIYSILALFLWLACILFCIGGKRDSVEPRTPLSSPAPQSS